MNPKNNKPLGNYGENLAREFLESQGYTILNTKFQKRYSEIDIIASEEDSLVFVEVKTRMGNEYGTPEEAITPWKIRSLTRAAKYYLSTNNVKESAVRIDAVCISLYESKKVKKISLYRNITGY